MKNQRLRIRETLDFLENDDINLGFRKLLDCVADTQELQLYKQAIDLNDWREQHPDDSFRLVEQAKDLLNRADQVQLSEYKESKPTVIAEAVTKKYASGNFSLGPISLEIEKGRVYGLVGENGNGKTTLLRILAGELRADKGRLNYNLDRSAKDAFDLRSKLVYIPQRTQRWYGSLKDNLKFVLSSYNVAPDENEVRVLFIIARLGLWKYRNLQWNELSSGYKMRFELARTLLRKPELLLLDEPLANLDVLAQQIILEDLKSIASSVNNPIALILSSQQLYEVEKISDKVVYLKNGRYTVETEEDGRHQNLVVEIETTMGRDELAAALNQLTVVKLTYNGGVYIVYFDNCTFNDVLSALGSRDASLTYIRDISNSTRKYFVA